MWLNRPIFHLQAPASHVGNCSNPGCCTSQAAPCLWLGKSVENGSGPWDLASARETGKKFLASLASDWLSSGAVAAILRVNQQMEASLCASFLLCKPVFQIKTNRVTKKGQEMSTPMSWFIAPDSCKSATGLGWTQVIQVSGRDPTP